eukprot:COSAG06_NODE_1565_length_9086_cov_34.853566_10_plen_486_part_00
MIDRMIARTTMDRDVIRVRNTHVPYNRNADGALVPTEAELESIALKLPDSAAAIVWAEALRPQTAVRKTSPCSTNIWLAAFVQLAVGVAIVVVAEGGEVLDQELATWLGVVFALFMVCEWYGCPTRRYITHMMLGEGAFQHVEQVREATPSLQWGITCYHYETRTRRKEDGTDERVQEMVVTHKATMAYVPFYWEDISSPLPDIGMSNFTRLHFEKTFVFADAEAAADFNNAKRTFIATNNRDKFYNFEEKYTIPGFEDFVLACKDKDDVPRWLSSAGYWLCTLLCCTIPFRIMFAKVCWEIPNYRYIKCFYNRRMEPISTPASIPVVAPGRIRWCADAGLATRSAPTVGDRAVANGFSRTPPSLDELIVARRMAERLAARKHRRQTPPRAPPPLPLPAPAAMAAPPASAPQCAAAAAPAAAPAAAAAPPPQQQPQAAPGMQLVQVELTVAKSEQEFRERKDETEPVGTMILADTASVSLPPHMP